MGLVANGYRLGFSPFAHRGGGLISIYGAARAPRNWNLPGRMRGLRYLTTEQSGLPHGGLAPSSWMLPQVAGAIVSRGNTTLTLSASGSVSRGLGVAGSTTMTLSATGSALGVGAVAGSAAIDMTASGDAYGLATVEGDATMTFAASGEVGAFAFAVGSASMALSAISTMGCIATVAGTANFAVDAGATLTADAVASAVWTRAIEAGYTAEQILRLLGAVAAGPATGLEGANPQFTGLDGTTLRIDGAYSAGTRTIDAIDAA